MYVARRALDRRSTATVLTVHSLLFAAATVIALAALVRIRVGLNYSPENLMKMIAIYTLAALPFFSGGAVISLAIKRLKDHVNIVYGADLIGAAVGLSAAAATAVTDSRARRGTARRRSWRRGGITFLTAEGDGGPALSRRRSGRIPGKPAVSRLGTVRREQHERHDADTVLFSKWNSFSACRRLRPLSWRLVADSKYKGPVPEPDSCDIDLRRVDAHPFASTAIYRKSTISSTSSPASPSPVSR